MLAGGEQADAAGRGLRCAAGFDAERPASLGGSYRRNRVARCSPARVAAFVARGAAMARLLLKRAELSGPGVRARRRGSGFWLQEPAISVRVASRASVFGESGRPPARSRMPASGRRQERATGEGSTSPDACFLGEHQSAWATAPPLRRRQAPARASTRKHKSTNERELGLGPAVQAYQLGFSRGQTSRAWTARQSQRLPAARIAPRGAAGPGAANVTPGPARSR